MKFNLTKQDAENFIKCLIDDTNLLRNYDCTDYSLLVSFHQKESTEFNNRLYPPIRVMSSSDDKYYYCLSLIDFLVSYDVKKKAEVILRGVTNYFKSDKNISAQPPDKYAERMVNFIIKSCIQIE